jgi:hypothetical protein
MVDKIVVREDSRQALESHSHLPSIDSVPSEPHEVLRTRILLAEHNVRIRGQEDQQEEAELILYAVARGMVDKTEARWRGLGVVVQLVWVRVHEAVWGHMSRSCQFVIPAGLCFAGRKWTAEAPAQHAPVLARTSQQARAPHKHRLREPVAAARFRRVSLNQAAREAYARCCRVLRGS